MYTMLVINVAPELEDALIDCLLEVPAVEHFSTCNVFSHGNSEHMTLVEQVRGRRKRLQVDLILPPMAVNKVLTLLRENVGGDAVYWEEPVRNFGRLNQVSQLVG